MGLIDVLLSLLQVIALALVVIWLPQQFERVRRSPYIIIPGQAATAQVSLSRRMWRLAVTLIGVPLAKRLGGDAPTVELTLRRAGYRTSDSIQFFTVRLASALGAGILALTLGVVAGNLVRAALMLFGASLLGYLLPWILVQRRAKKRALRALNEAPSWLTNYAVLMAAGQTAEAALDSLSSQGDGILYAEGRIAAKELLVQKSLRDALLDMEKRIGSPEIRSALLTLIDRAESAATFRTALAAESRHIEQEVETRVRNKLADNQNFALVVMVLFAMPLLFYVILVPFFLKLLVQLGTGS